MLRIVDVIEAERTILRRRPPGEEIPAALRAGLRRVFGQDITPQEGVRRILADVRMLEIDISDAAELTGK